MREMEETISHTVVTSLDLNEIFKLHSVSRGPSATDEPRADIVSILLDSIVVMLIIRRCQNPDILWCGAYVECHDITVSPDADCVPEGETFRCTSTGYPGTADYSWTHWQWAPTSSLQTASGVSSYPVVQPGQHTLQCTAAYSAPIYCPAYMAHCHSNVTFRAFGQYMHTNFILNLHNWP